MAIIKCPECGNDISDKAEHCIHCGFPISSYIEESTPTVYSVILDGYNEKYGKDMTDSFMMTHCVLSQRYGVSKFIKKDDFPFVLFNGMSLENADYVINDLRNVGCISHKEKSNTQLMNPLNTVISERRKSSERQLECPHCHSKNVMIGKRGFSLLTGFIGANKTVNRCGNCGWRWEPLNRR